MCGCFSPPSVALLFWSPRRPEESETAFLEECVAKQKLLGEFPALKNDLRRDEAEFREIVTRIYYDGEIVYGDGRMVIGS